MSNLLLRLWRGLWWKPKLAGQPLSSINTPWPETAPPGQRRHPQARTVHRRLTSRGACKKDKALQNTTPWLAVTSHPPRCLSSLLEVARPGSESLAQRPKRSRMTALAGALLLAWSASPGRSWRRVKKALGSGCSLFPSPILSGKAGTLPPERTFPSSQGPITWETL